MYSFIIYLITFFEPPKRPNKSPALTSSWPNIDGHKELTISLNCIFALISLYQNLFAFL